tara:strand:- start:1271 stop:1396 length:126 start_codon:yes stop_codon:yes gene_type:complete
MKLLTPGQKKIGPGQIGTSSLLVNQNLVNEQLFGFWLWFGG